MELQMFRVDDATSIRTPLTKNLQAKYIRECLHQNYLHTNIVNINIYNCCRIKRNTKQFSVNAPEYIELIIGKPLAQY